MPTPFETDSEIARAAERAGFTEIVRRRRIKLDIKALPPFYWTKKPDYRLIEKHLDQGIAVPGAEFSGEVEYAITGPKEAQPCQS
jgi:hypothetical protein